MELDFIQEKVRVDGTTYIHQSGLGFLNIDD